MDRLEIRALRRERSKTYSLAPGHYRTVIKTRPVHFFDGAAWQDIDLSIRQAESAARVALFLADQNKISIGLRRDREIERCAGLRPYGRSDIQMEWTPVSVRIDGAEQIPKRFSRVSGANREATQTLGRDAALVHRLTATSLVSVYRLPDAHDVEIVERIDLTGLSVANKSADGVYLPDERGRYLFLDRDGALRFWLKPPWVDRGAGHERLLSAELRLRDGQLLYSKWGVLAGGPALVDSTTYYSETWDGRVYSGTYAGWAACRADTTASGTGASVTANESEGAFGAVARLVGSDYSICRVFLAFDTSGLPDGASVSAATLRVYGYSTEESNVSIQAGTQGSPLGLGDYDAFGAPFQPRVDPWVAGDWNESALSDTSVVNATGDTRFCLREYDHDASNAAPTAVYRNGLYFGESGSYPPELVVDYSVVHALTALDAVGSAPVADVPTLGQEHQLAAQDAIGAAPVADAPTLGITYLLTAQDIVGQPPTTGAPSLTQYAPVPWRPRRWEDWEIELIDGDLDTIGLLDEAIGAKIVWGCYGYGDGSLSLHIASDRAQDLLGEEMFYFRFFRAGSQIRDFMLAKDDRGYTVSNQYVDEYIQVSLSPLDLILKDRLCLPDGGSGDFNTPSLPLDDAMKWIVDHACGPSAYDDADGGSRAIAGLTIAANESAHGTTRVVTEAHKAELFAFLTKFGPLWSVDWRVRLERTTGIANQMVFETFYPGRGSDKRENGTRYALILNDASGEVRQARRYRPAVGFANAVIAEDLQSEVRDDASIAVYGRHEVLANTSQTNAMQALLESRKRRVGYEVEFAGSEMLDVGTAAHEVQPGDTITISNHHLDLPADDQLVKAITFMLRQDGAEKAAITVGEYEKSLKDKVQETAFPGGGGGGGGGGAGYFDPIRGLKDDAGTFVPFSDEVDYQYVQLTTDGGLSATGNVGTNAIALALLSHDIVSKHTASGLTPGQVLTALTATTFGFTAPVVVNHQHTITGVDNHRHGISGVDDHQHTIGFSGTHTHQIGRRESPTGGPSDGAGGAAHTHQYHHLTSIGDASGLFASDADGNHSHTGYTGWGGEHNHSGYTGYAGSHDHGGYTGWYGA